MPFCSESAAMDFSESPPPKKKSHKLGTDSDHEITSKSVLLFLTSDKAVCCLDESGDEPKSKLWSQLYLQLKHHELERLKKILFSLSFSFSFFPSSSELQIRENHVAKSNLPMEE